MATKPKVNVWEELHWECPSCAEENASPSWLLRGDTVACTTCGCKCEVREHTAACRPQKFEGKKATAYQTPSPTTNPRGGKPKRGE